MAAGGVVALELVVDLRRGAQRALQAVGADERGGAVHFIELADLFGDVDVAVTASSSWCASSSQKTGRRSASVTGRIVAGLSIGRAVPSYRRAGCTTGGESGPRRDRSCAARCSISWRVLLSDVGFANKRANKKGFLSQRLLGQKPWLLRYHPNCVETPAHSAY